MKFLLLGDNAITVQFSDEISEEVNRLIRFVCTEAEKIEGVTECVPTFVSLSVFFDPLKIKRKKLVEKIKKIADGFSDAKDGKKKVFLIPTCFEDEFAPDLDFVAKHANLTKEEVVKIHTGSDYLIYMLGFLPGFPYLGGLDERLHTPRLETPRTVIPAGSVGIGGKQTGIYPLPSPGGWQLIGRTPVKPYDAKRENPILYSAGDYIRFVPIAKSEFFEIEKQVENQTYIVKVVEI